MESFGYSQLGIEILNLLDLNESRSRSVQNRYTRRNRNTLSRLADALNLDKSTIHRYLSVDENGNPLVRISIFNLIRIIVAIRPDIDTAYKWICMAGYSIECNYIPDNVIYRQILNHLNDETLDDLNERLEKIHDVGRNQKTVVFELS